MAAAYSMDLRTRVLQDADAGLSSKELTQRSHVIRAWVDRSAILPSSTDPSESSKVIRADSTDFSQRLFK